jgi:phosphatidylglycerophosphatase C
VQTAAPEAIALRIDAARRARPGGAIAFDGDGTLWSGDVGDDFLHAFIARGRVDPPAAAAMLALARAHGVDAPMDGRALPTALFEAYVAGRVPEEPICEMVAYACAGWTSAEVMALAREVVLAAGLPGRLHAETVALVEWAKGAGVEAFVVSASPVVVVAEAVRALGFDAAHVVAATPVEDAGVLCAEVHRPIPYGEGKVTRLRERMGARPLYAAFGDNVFDVRMLRSAEVAVAVRPKPRLVERAGDVPGLVELEKRA